MEYKNQCTDLAGLFSQREVALALNLGKKYPCSFVKGEGKISAGVGGGNPPLDGHSSSSLRQSNCSVATCDKMVLPD